MTTNSNSALPAGFNRLNLAQACGALNDNLIKLLIVFYLVSQYGQERAATIAAIGSAAFVLPFLLFSALAGSLADRLRNLGNQIQDLSRQARKTQKEASNKLAEAAGAIQEDRLPERILSGNALIQNGYYESQMGREGFIRNSLEGLNKQLESTRGSIGQTKEEKLEEAANRARQLSEGLESVQQRLSQAQRGQGNRSGRQTGKPDQQGQQGPAGQQGQQGRGQNQQGQPLRLAAHARMACQSR